MKTKQSTVKKSVLAFILMIAEAIISLLLRFDRPLKARLYPLVKENLLVCVRTYLPHYIIYIHFTENGVLLDVSPPEGMVEGSEDVLISGSSLTLLRLIANGDENLLTKLQFRGQNTHIDMFKECLSNIGFQRITKDFLQNIIKISPEQNRQQASAIASYQKKLSDYQLEIDNLQTNLTTKEKTLIQLKKRLQYQMFGLVVLAISLIVMVVIHFGK